MLDCNFDIYSLEFKKEQQIYVLHFTTIILFHKYYITIILQIFVISL